MVGWSSTIGKASTGHAIDGLVGVYDAVHDKIGADAWLSAHRTGEEFADGIDMPYDDSGPAERPLHVGDPTAASFAILIDKDGRLRWEMNNINGGHNTCGSARFSSRPCTSQLVKAFIPWNFQSDVRA